MAEQHDQEIDDDLTENIGQRYGGTRYQPFERVDRTMPRRLREIKDELIPRVPDRPEGLDVTQVGDEPNEVSGLHVEAVGHVEDADDILDYVADSDDGTVGHTLSEHGFGRGRVVTQTRPGVNVDGPAPEPDAMLHYAAQTDDEIGHRLFGTEYNPFEGAEAPNGMQDVEGAQPVDLVPDYDVGPAPDNSVDDFRPIDIPQGAELVDDLGSGVEPNPFDLAD